MTISKENHLSLLKDILSTHCQDCCATSAQYKQASRITDNLLVEFGHDEDIKKVLSEIQKYCNEGSQLSIHNDYINENKNDLTNWVQHLNTIS